MKTKICTKCKEEYPATVGYFYEDKSKNDGMCCLCKKCNKKNNENYRTKNKKEIKKYNIKFNQKLKSRKDNEIPYPKIKKCNKCGKIRLSKRFFKRRLSKDGLNNYCKECDKKFRDKHKEEKRLINKRYCKKLKSRKDNEIPYPKIKKCNKCGKIRLSKRFFKNRGNKDGLSSHCKKCVKKYNAKFRQKNKEKIREYSQKYYQKYKEKIKKYIKKWYQEHGEEVREYNKKLHRKNKEQDNERNRKRYQRESQISISGYIYFIKDNNLIKIGVTAVNLKFRLKSLLNVLKRPVVLLRAFEANDMYKLESELHHVFKKYRHTHNIKHSGMTEWFKLPKKIINKVLFSNTGKELRMEFVKGS